MTDRLDMLLDDEQEEDWNVAQADLLLRVQAWLWKPFPPNQRAQMLMELVDVYLEVRRQMLRAPCRVNAHSNWTCCARHLRQTSIMGALSGSITHRLEHQGCRLSNTFSSGWWRKVEDTFGIDTKGLRNA